MVGDLPFLPAGTTLPPAAPYLLVVLLATGGVVAALRRRRPRVTGRRVLALAPWMALGSAAHVLYVVDALPPSSPFAGSPTVYLTVGSLAGAAWLVADATRPDRVPAVLAVAGTLLLAPVVAVAVSTGLSPEGARWSTIALVLTIPIAGAVWVGLTRLRPETAITGGVGALAVFAHALDGVSTAVGTTHLGFGERTPVSRILLEIGGLRRCRWSARVAVPAREARGRERRRLALRGVHPGRPARATSCSASWPPSGSAPRLTTCCCSPWRRNGPEPTDTVSPRRHKTEIANATATPANMTACTNGPAKTPITA